MLHGSALRSARLPVNLIGSPINYANRLIGSPITSQSTSARGPELLMVHALMYHLGCSHSQRARDHMPAPPPARRGTGVGRQLLQSLVERGSGSDIYLTTLGSTVGFYEREGFQEVSSDAIPRCVPTCCQEP